MIHGADHRIGAQARQELGRTGAEGRRAGRAAERYSKTEKVFL